VPRSFCPPFCQSCYASAGAGKLGTTQESGIAVTFPYFEPPLEPWLHALSKTSCLVRGRVVALWYAESTACWWRLVRWNAATQKRVRSISILTVRASFQSAFPSAGIWGCAPDSSLSGARQIHRWANPETCSLFNLDRLRCVRGCVEWRYSLICDISTLCIVTVAEQVYSDDMI